MEKTTMNETTANEYLYKYAEIQARIDRLEVEKSLLKDKLGDMLKSAGLREYTGAGQVAQFRDKHTFQFDVPLILKVVPTAASVLKINDKDYNKILVGHEQELANARKLLKTDTTLYITSQKSKGGK